jgi:hypothetical protein
LVRRFARCSRCGYLQIEEEDSQRYRGKQSLDDLPEVGHGRIGTDGEPGREFKIARMAVAILDRPSVDVMVYGIGRSLDNVHIEQLPRVGAVAIGDIVKVRDDAEFHDANQRARKRFSVVVASEVVEHFRKPRDDFAKLFQFVGRDGLLVCATNIYRGGELSQDRYPFWPDHTSYYTAQALLELARPHGFLVDFRTPRVTGPNGRKRYVFFSRSPEVMQRVAQHFAAITMAPSEDPPAELSE